MSESTDPKQAFVKQFFRGVLGAHPELAQSMLLVDSNGGESSKEAIDEIEIAAQAAGAGKIVRMSAVTAEQFFASMAIRSDVVHFILLDQMNREELRKIVTTVVGNRDAPVWGHSLLVGAVKDGALRLWSLLHRFDVVIDVGPKRPEVIKNRLGPTSEQAQERKSISLGLPWLDSLFNGPMPLPISMAIVDDNGGMRGSDLISEIEKAAQRFFEDKSILRITGVESCSVESVLQSLEVTPKLLLLDALPMARASYIASSCRYPSNWQRSLRLRGMSVIYACLDKTHPADRLTHDVDVLLSVDQRSVMVRKNRFGPIEQVIQRAAG